VPVVWDSLLVAPEMVAVVVEKVVRVVGIVEGFEDPLVFTQS